MFLSFAVSTEQMGNKIYKMLKMNFDTEPKILTRHTDSIDESFNEDIYSFVVSKNNEFSLDLSKSNFLKQIYLKIRNFIKMWMYQLMIGHFFICLIEFIQFLTLF